jgi:hypothetical protein
MWQIAHRRTTPKPTGTMTNKLRVIEYEFMLWEDLERLLDLVDLVEAKMGRVPEVSILRCTAREDAKVTLVGTVAATRTLIESGRASRPGGVVIAKSDFPVMINGWPYRFGAE